MRKVLAHAVGYLGYQSGILEVMSIAEFKLAAPFKPTGDQPQAIRKLVEWFKKGFQYQTLLGVHVRARMTLTQNHHS